MSTWAGQKLIRQWEHDVSTLLIKLLAKQWETNLRDMTGIDRRQDFVLKELLFVIEVQRLNSPRHRVVIPLADILILDLPTLLLKIIEIARQINTINLLIIHSWAPVFSGAHVLRNNASTTSELGHLDFWNASESPSFETAHTSWLTIWFNPLVPRVQKIKSAN